jgi:hypothetical protein
VGCVPESDLKLAWERKFLFAGIYVSLQFKKKQYTATLKDLSVNSLANPQEELSLFPQYV